MGTMDIRLAKEADLSELGALFCQTVLVNAPKYYTLAQTTVWAASPDDAEQFRQFIFGVTTFVATDDAGLLGFAGIGEDGHVASAYVRYDSLHQGIGSTLMQAVLDYAQNHRIHRLYAEASEFSLGLFKKFGFQLYDTELVDRHGVQFTRYLVKRQL